MKDRNISTNLDIANLLLDIAQSVKMYEINIQSIKELQYGE